MSTVFSRLCVRVRVSVRVCLREPAVLHKTRQEGGGCVGSETDTRRQSLYVSRGNIAKPNAQLAKRAASQTRR